MMPKLVKAQIHPTHHCNLKCIFCDVPIRSVGKKDLPDEKWISLVNDLCELKPRVVTISGGGEPFLRMKLLIYIIKILHLAGIKIEIITNGTFISDEVTKTIAECCHHYRVSLHATLEDLDEILRGKKGSVKLSLEGIRKIAGWKKKLGREEPTIDIAMVLTKFNMSEIGKMIEKASEVGANRISLRIVHKWGEKYRPSEEQMNELKKNIRLYEKMAAEKNLNLIYDFLIGDIFSQSEEQNIENVGTSKNEPICTLPFRELVIFADGRVSPCCNFIIDPEEYDGVDSVKEKSLITVWNGDEFNKIRKFMKTGKDNLPKTCVECSIDLKPIDQRYKN